MLTKRAGAIHARHALDLTIEMYQGQDAHFFAGTAVFWACALDELLDDELSSYRTHRDSDEDGRVLPALRFVRNGIAHGPVNAAESRGLEYPIRFPMDFGPSVWAPVEILLKTWSPRDKFDRQGEREIYAAEVSGALIAEPIMRARNWFSRLEKANWDLPATES